MQSQEGQGTLDKCEASQRWGEFTRIKSGCGFKRSSDGKSFDPKTTIQMIKVIGVHVGSSSRRGTVEGRGALVRECFCCPDGDSPQVVFCCYEVMELQI